MDARYQAQDRGAAQAYDRYLAGMDASMRQKVALTAAHLLCVGEVADMGMGSGSGSQALAALYPALKVVGVDVSKEMVARATERHVLPNLRFVEGDVGTTCFPDGHLDAVLLSSVLHHVTSFNGYDHDAARRSLVARSAELRDDGVMIVRDFLRPDGGQVWLDLPADDGEPTALDPVKASTAALFERFAQEFRPLLAPEGQGFSFARGEDPRPGWRRFICDEVHAVEFVLRKDYRADWGTEVLEEYTYATQGDLLRWMSSLGLRVLACTPLRNPWIVRNRFEGRFSLSRADSGTPLDPPATNVVVVGQKARPGEGVTLESGGEVAPVGYLDLSHHLRVADGRVIDLVRRPNATIDVLPWYQAEEGIFVLARRSYPRPIPLVAGSRAIDGTTPSTWLHEPLNVQRQDKPLGQTVEALLGQFASLGPDSIVAFGEPMTVYPSPGGLQEEVHSIAVEVRPVAVDEPLRVRNGFSTAGTLRALEARQLLRAAQVGGLPDNRLEMAVYDLLLDRGEGVGPWIGEGIALPHGPDPGPGTSVRALLDAAPRRAFRPHVEGAGFLEVRAHRFLERDQDGRVVGEQVLESVHPRKHTDQTVAAAVLARRDDGVYIAVDDDDLPAAQCFSGRSNLLVAPAWRLPTEAISIRGSRVFVRERLALEYGLELLDCFELGGRYHPSAGAAPEVVWPLACVVRDASPGVQTALWVRLDEVVAERRRIRDGHLRTVALRAAHALGLLRS